MFGTALQEQAGIRLHSGKTRVWNKAGIHPRDVDDLGPDVWCKDGVKILGTLVGSDSYVEVATDERINEEARLWAALAWVPDLQCAWQILLQCAGPRCHHFLHTVLPHQSAKYADNHDKGMMEAMQTVLGSIPGSEVCKEEGRQLATLPMRLGGLGLRSASRTAPAAYWASWADALPMLSARLPELTDGVEAILNANPQGCLRDLDAAGILDRSGFVGRPSWRELRGGVQPPQPSGVEPGEWQHGWHSENPWSLSSRVPPSRPTSDPIQAQGRAQRCTELPQRWSSRSNRTSHLSWRDCDCLLM